MTFTGTFTPDFATFVRRRSAILSLDADIDLTATRAQIRVCGAEALVGALEMAASIGPEGTLVDDWSVEPLA